MKVGKPVVVDGVVWGSREADFVAEGVPDREMREKNVQNGKNRSRAGQLQRKWQ